MTTLIDFILCDDVRFEQLNKLTLVGVYSDGITASGSGAMPIALNRIGIFMRLNLDEGSPLPDGFRLRCLLGEKSFAEVDGSLMVGNPSRPVTLAFNAGPVIIENSTTLNFELTLLRGLERVALLKPEGVPVTIGQIEAPTIQAPQ